MRLRRLKLRTHVDNGRMYRVYRNQAAAAYLSLYFFIFSQFQTIKFFVTLFSGTVRPRRLKLGSHMSLGRCTVYTGIRLLLLLHFFINFSFSPIFKHYNFSSHLSQDCDTYKVETWYTREQWADVLCILESGCCCLFISLFLQFSFSPIFKH